MNEEKQRIAIAEARGFKKIRVDDTGSLIGEHNASLSRKEFKVPDYLGDLNAIYGVVTDLNVAGIIRYRGILTGIVTRQGYISDAIDATATQRAEAFLRTIGKWEDAE